MKRIHALIIAVAFGAAVVLGSFAALRTTHAASAPAVSAAEIARQNRALNRAESSLRAELRRKPTAAATAPTIVYHRPPPVVHVIHRHGGEAEGGAELDD